MSSSIIKTNYLGAQTLTSEQLTALIIGAFASYPAGSILVRIAGWLTRAPIAAAAGGCLRCRRRPSRITRAAPTPSQSTYLHLTSHYKQSRMRLHLHYLWHEVFSIRPDGKEADERVGGLVDDPSAPPPPLERDTDELALFLEKPFASDRDRRAHDEFVNLGLAALSTPLPMRVQSSTTGFHLGPVEDWYEKGFFAYEDFPAKAFSRDPLVRRVRRLVEPRTRHWARRLLAADVAPSFWYALTVRRFASLLGKSLTALNREAERQGFPDYFDAQHFLWPSDRLDALVATDFSRHRYDLQRRLMALRWGLIREVFSDDEATARRHLMRMFARDYAAIVEIRLRFDAAWAGARLTDNPERELDAVATTFSLSPVPANRVASLMSHARSRLDALDRLMKSSGNDAVDPRLREVLEIATVVNYRGFNARIVETGDGAALRDLLSATDDFARDVGLLRELLYRVRIYHALIKLQVIDYWSIVRRIGELG